MKIFNAVDVDGSDNDSKVEKKVVTLNDFELFEKFLI